MAVFQLTEFRAAPIYAGSVVPIAALPAITTQEKTLSGSAQDFAALNAETEIVCLHSSGVCSWNTGASSAVTTANRRPADFVEYFAVKKGAGLIISVISNT
jgi:hypothetical protein